MAKPTWLSLNGLWEYAPSDGYTPPAFGQSLAGQILVPFPAESALSGVMEHSDFMLYRRTVTVPASYRTKRQRVQLHFGAVNYAATVWVNGRRLTEHTGGYEAFSVDVTDALRKRGPQEIVVGVASPVDSEDIPVGKQRLKPDGIFYTAASGIWQSVWMEPVARTQGDRRLGTLKHRVGDQGITTASGALLPQGLGTTVRPADGPVSVVAARDGVRLDAVLVRPLLSSAVLRGTTTTALLQSTSAAVQRTQVVPAGSSAWLRVYDWRGRLKESRRITGPTSVQLPAHGIAVVTG